MKNFVGIIVIFGMTVLVLTSHSMMVMEIHILKKERLACVDPFSNMEKLSIVARGCFQGHGERFYKNQLHDDQGLPLSLAAIKFLEERDPKEGEKTLKTIKTAVGGGIPVESHYYPTTTSEIEYEDDFHIFYNKTPVSVFWLIKNWCKNDLSINETKKNALVNAIIQSRQERPDGKGVPIKQAEQKFHKGEKQQPARLNESLSGGSIYQIISFCPLWKLLQGCIALVKN